MNSRRRAQPAPVRLTPLRSDRPTAGTRTSQKSMGRSEASQRRFHPVTSTLVILGSGVSAFFVVYTFTYKLCQFLGI